MHSPCADPRRSRTTGALRAIALVLVAAPIVLLGAASMAENHAVAGNPHGAFKAECGLCHGTQAWKPAKISRRFDHAKFGFPLSGAHAAAACTACHASLDFTQAKQRCASCHEDPHHAELGDDCSRCHGARSFVDRAPMSRMHQLTRFPLTGAHAGLDCETCHPPTAQGQMQFVGTQAECDRCHMEQYRAVRNPDHVAGGFPTDCRSCHSTLTWSRAAFDHARTAFPLTGAHRGVACLSCHGDGVYHGKSMDCASCHRADYDATTDPNHVAAGFALACATCHTTTSWSGATFDHDAAFFPIDSGTHRGRWSACADCHTVASNYASFTCLSCHPHSDQTETDGHHQGMSGYRYDSQACYSCHPRGRS